MAASEDESSCLVSRGRSQSDPSVLTDSSATSSADAGENPGNGRAGAAGQAGKARAGGAGLTSPALLRVGSAFGEPRQDSGAQAPRELTEEALMTVYYFLTINDLLSRAIPMGSLQFEFSVYME
ncbi:hypothetical protein E5288_WYG004141 [Bos mutus]|uniref:Uncharacterized protein n=1 Tax=Bos mutus TaxID=72004 RepID=A0A6B0R5Z0_9CETA|nr:hypothetical protein [Bos mutus]